MCLCAVLTDRVIYIGLAPDIPEDLYMLIKKVRFFCSSLKSLGQSETNSK